MVLEAQERLRPYVAETPLFPCKVVSKVYGGNVFLKLETLQPIGVFKIRGALNRLLSLTDEQRSRGVVTASSGNHGIAVAYAANLLGVRAVVYVPESANPRKAGAIRNYGATLIQKGRDYQESYEAAILHASTCGTTFVHAYDDPWVIAGQGTIGLEILNANDAIDSVIVGVGGGGLISGIALAAKNIKPSLRVVGVQAEGASAVHDSWKANKIIEAENVSTIADGLASRKPGELTFALMRKYVDNMLLVGDSELISAVSLFLRDCRLVVEPAGAAPLAALKERYKPKEHEQIALVVSGGNISSDLLHRVVEEVAREG